MNAPVKKPRLLGVIGIVVGLVAMTTAFLSPWIQEKIDPPSKSPEEITVNFATRLAAAAKSKLNGEAYKPNYETSEKPSRFLFPSVILTGLLATSLGVAAYLRSEDKLIAGGAIALGLGAAVIQWSILIAGSLMGIIVILVVLSFLLGG